MQERTAAQVFANVSPDGELGLPPASDSAWAKKVRKMRRDPTLGFLRDMYMAPILGADWTVVADDKKYQDAVPLITASTLPHRSEFLRNSLRGLLDFGWQSFEVVKDFAQDGSLVVTKLKPLLQDLTTILVASKGQLVGVRNLVTQTFGEDAPTGQVDLYRDECIVMYRDVEGTNWYGEPIMRRCERPYDAWLASDDAAARFDKKVAGAHWVVYFPMGKSDFNGRADVDNYEIAKDLLNSLESSGKIAIPQTVLGQVTDLNNLDSTKMGWRVELLSAQTNQSNFVDRGKYLDSLKARGVGIPERAIFEGQFGTKAEAEAHADFAIDNLEMAHRDLLGLLNKQLVDRVLSLNKGPSYQTHVQVVAAPLSDVRKAALRTLYSTYFSTPDGQAEESDAIDWAAMRDELNIPVKQVTQNV